MAEGWVKLHRSITENWIWDNPQYLKWWLDLILMANHKEKKILFNGSFKKVGVGERITSEQKLAERWGVSRNTVRKFLDLLVEDEMITVERSRQKGTTYKVNNYAVYQGFSDEKKQRFEQQTEHQKDIELNNELNINKNEKNDKNEKKIDDDRESDFADVFQLYEKLFGVASPLMIQNLEYWIEDLSAELVIAALKKSEVEGAFSFKYTEKIMKNWEKQGVKNLDDVAKADKKFEEKNKRKNNRQPKKLENSGSSDYDNLPI